MPFSRLFPLLVLAGVIPIIAASFFGLTLQVFVGYNMIIICIWLTDFAITPGSRSFELERICENKLSMGSENDIFIAVLNKSRYTVSMELADEIPGSFMPPYMKIILKAPARSRTLGRYGVTPLKRGEFTFGSIYCRYKGVLGLCSRQVKYDLTKNIKVYPNLRDLKKYSLAALNKSLLMGDMKNKSYSIGTEFESLREYSSGDDYRRINWMATAREGKFIVNSYQPEMHQHVFVLMDTSRTMNSEINSIKKLDYAVNAAFVLANTALVKGDYTGLMVFDNMVKRYVNPGKGQSHYRLLTENLYNVHESFVSADYNEALLYLNTRQKRRSLLCIFTELQTADEARRLAVSLKSLAKQHVPLVITINDNRIEEYTRKNIKEAYDVYVKSAAMQLMEERGKIRRLLTQAGIACIDVPPDKLSLEAVGKYLSMKATLQF